MRRHEPTLEKETAPGERAEQMPASVDMRESTTKNARVSAFDSKTGSTAFDKQTNKTRHSCESNWRDEAFRIVSPLKGSLTIRHFPKRGRRAK